ncbi:MAG: FAD-binding protein [Rubellimicrobium sp.]|nr:FAD-binding protein [Rubellimicrobium sp.]
MRPRSEAELAALIAGAPGPLRVTGGGTRGLGGAGRELSVAELTGITLHEPGALTMVARAGTPVAQIEAALAAEGQHLPWEPGDARALTGLSAEPTIGAVIATNSSGPRRVVAGAARDFLLGVRFVDGMGNVVANGGRVMKNVTGLDLSRLMAGAHGTLGVLSEVSFKVLPRPRATLTLGFCGLDPARAVAAMARALGSACSVSGAAHLPETGETWLRLEGTAESVAARAGKLALLLRDHGSAQEVAADWEAVRDGRALAGAGAVWRLALTPTAGPGVIARLPEGARWFLDWGGGRLWVGAAAGMDLRGALGAIPGHATRLTGPGPGRFHPEPEGVAALTRALRARFDPRGILNPGLFD